MPVWGTQITTPHVATDYASVCLRTTLKNVEKENITISDDDFKSFVDYLVSSGNSQMADENAVYKYYGGGNKEDGKKTVRQMYVVNQAISYVVEKANITVKPDTQTTESSEN